MLFSRLNFSSELTSCGHWGKWNATFYFHAVLLMSFCGWNTDWAITWGMRCSVMFIRVKTSSTEEGMITFTHALLCTSLRCIYGSDTGTGADRGRSSQCLCWVSEAAPRGVYTAICHATSKTVKTPFVIWISWKKLNKVPKRFVTNTCTVTPLVLTAHLFRQGIIKFGFL